MAAGTLCPLKLTRQDETNVKISGDEKTCNITGLDITAAGHFILTDSCNDVKLLFPDGQLLSSLQLSDPVYVAVVDESTAAVSMLGRQIVITDLGDQLSKRENIQLDRTVDGITAYKNNIILACKSQL